MQNKMVAVVVVVSFVLMKTALDWQLKHIED